MYVYTIERENFEAYTLSKLTDTDSSIGSDLNIVWYQIVIDDGANT